MITRGARDCRKLSGLDDFVLNASSVYDIANLDTVESIGPCYEMWIDVDEKTRPVYTETFQSTNGEYED